MSNAPPADQLAAFVEAIRQHESGGNYTAYNSGGGASGAYQFIQSTWSNAAKAAGYAQYASMPAGAAPPAVQDAVAESMASGYYQHYGNWRDSAEAWYYPAWAGVAQYQNAVPYPSAGNTETIGAYGSQIVSSMNSILGGKTQIPNSAPASSSSGASGASAVAPQSVLSSDIWNPLTWGAGYGGFLEQLGGKIVGSGSTIGDVATNIGSMASNLAKFSAAVLYPGTWIRFGEVLLGVIIGSTGLAMFVMILAQSGPGLNAISSVASILAPEESIGMKLGGSLASTVGAGARAAGGSPNKAARAVSGAKSSAARRHATAARAGQALQRSAQRDASLQANERRAEQTHRQRMRHREDTHRQKSSEHDYVMDQRRHSDSQGGSRRQAAQSRKVKKDFLGQTGKARHVPGPLFGDEEPF